MGCLGERLTALVDGELGHDERDKVLAHLAVCARCRAEAATLRSLKGRLRGLGGAPAPGTAVPGIADLGAADPGSADPGSMGAGLTDPRLTDPRLTDRGSTGAGAAGGGGTGFGGADDLPTGDFLSRLHDIGKAAAAAEPPSGAPDASGSPDATSGRPTRPPRSSTRPARPPRSARPGRAAAFARPRDTRPAGHAAALARPRRRYLVMGAATLVLGLGSASYAVGGQQDGPSVTPEFDRFAVEHAMTSGDAPVTGPLVEPVTEPLGGTPAPLPTQSVPVSAGP